MKFVNKLMQAENKIILSVVTQTQKDKNAMHSLILDIRSKIQDNNLHRLREAR